MAEQFFQELKMVLLIATKKTPLGNFIFKSVTSMESLHCTKGSLYYKKAWFFKMFFTLYL